MTETRIIDLDRNLTSRLYFIGTLQSDHQTLDPQALSPFTTGKLDIDMARHTLADVLCLQILRGRRGAGRPSATEVDPELVEALERLVDPGTRGDSESPLRWTSKSTQTLAKQLRSQGHQVGPRTVAKLLKTLGYSL
jgi:hypothetical protein